MCLDAKIMFITAPEAKICKLEMTEYHDSYMYVGCIVYYGGHLEFQDDWQATHVYIQIMPYIMTLFEILGITNMFNHHFNHSVMLRVLCFI